MLHELHPNKGVTKEQSTEKKKNLAKLKGKTIKSNVTVGYRRR